MDDLFLVSGLQRCGDLVNNIEGQCHWHRPSALDDLLQRFAFHELHGIEIIAILRSEMKNRGHIRMAKSSCGPGLPHKAEAR